MERLVELWYKIPREKEWWIDRISELLTGCSTGCFVLVLTYVLTVAAAVLVSLFVVPNNPGEAFFMGLAWGSSLSIVTGAVGGSAILALWSAFRGT